MSASFNMRPPKDSPGILFLKSQFCATVQWPPKDTNLEGRVAIITGSTSGLGLESARQLLSFGLSGLIMAVRSTEKGEQSFSRRADAELSRLDIVILNAGVQTAYFSIIPGTGHEKLVQVNYPSTMLLGILLLPILKAKSPSGQPGRLTIISSGTARGAKISQPNGATVLSALDDKSRPWDPVERYAVTKLLGHLFMANLAQYVSADDVVVNLADPGLVKDTGLQRLAPPLVAAFFYCYKVVLGRTVPVGASTYVDAVVVKGKESHSCYIANWEISPFAAFIYLTLEGETVREQLWKETMVEFEFVEAQRILEDLKK
ncbi:hypothetical protein F5Y13DRAFT_207186 [Hypoxylon sp. FL1857]|nr:hypothetical protein F5Y13DRAFT_207186 [Hypoxylon sp. FL1857]